MIVVVFRIRLNPGVESEFQERLDEMLKLAADAPGLVGLHAFSSDDGELAYVIEWDSEESLLAWRNSSEHLVAMREGREKFYASYSLQICEERRRIDFPGASASALG